MPKILFGQSYYLRFDPKLWQAMQPYPPLGTLLAASFMRAHGYRVALFDAMLAESEKEWASALDREQPDFAVLYEDNFNYLSKMCLLRMREAALTMIRMANQRGIPVVAGGSDASDHAGLYLDHGANYVLVGEGEKTLGELIDRLSGRADTPLEQIYGLAFPGPSTTKTVYTPRRPDIRDLDALPFPAWDLVDIPQYKKIWRKRHGYYSMNMVTTRGCPYHCNWCAKPIWGQRYNVRSPEYVAAEMKWLKDMYQPDHIWFADDIMGLKPGWLPRFAELVDKHNARIPFKCLSRVDLLLREGDIPALKRAGAEIVWVGAESGSQKILTAMEKGTQVQQIYEATRALREAGIRVAFFLQFGYPGETREDIEKTLQMVRDLMPDDIGVSVSYPLPGTKFFTRVQDQFGEKQNWQDSRDLAMLYHGPYSSDFYRQLHLTLHKEYRARKTWRALQDLVRRPGDLRPIHFRRIAGMAYHFASLPLARRRLKKLEQAPHKGMALHGQGMSLEESARPTSQD